MNLRHMVHVHEAEIEFPTFLTPVSCIKMFSFPVWFHSILGVTKVRHDRNCGGFLYAGRVVLSSRVLGGINLEIR